MYNTEDLCCVLPEGCYRLWIKNKAVVVRPDRHCVETDRHAEPTVGPVTLLLIVVHSLFMSKERRTMPSLMINGAFL
ncbi:hypothetical protein SCLCIDRAFT_1225078 [Scleroderma citrinum Foug A]|uniref:Uncharacterized protein n=1 Tax=Scleroderma citrinum Foug A TaxID=1036808 RepID=A0A0C3D326_9AGAM|nr:hypothetical protein SCLCIDRAFT_1225078 [Scleroderma citrinum Foug A]